MFLTLMILSSVVLGSVQTPPAADRPPRSLTEIHDTALAAFDQALRNDWPGMADSVATLSRVLDRLGPDAGDPDLVGQLNARFHALRDAVRDRQATEAATNANWTARLADEMSEKYETVVPGDVRLLSFFARALEVDATRGSGARTSPHVADLRTVWLRVEPAVLQRGGVDVARQFNDALAGLDAAMQRGDLMGAARAEVRASEQVTQLFRQHSRSH